MQASFRKAYLTVEEPYNKTINPVSTQSHYIILGGNIP